MIKKLTAFLAAALVAFSLAAADSANRIAFPLAGFSIAPLETIPGKAANQTALMMFMPASGGFAANVNVMIQSYPGTIEDYTATTVKQFKDNDMKVVSQKNVGKSAVVFEYTGELRGNPLHWYARAEKSGDHVYLTTGTSSEEQWPKLGTQLKACVDSFRSEKH
jgi:hypothetical protein